METNTEGVPEGAWSRKVLETVQALGGHAGQDQILKKLRKEGHPLLQHAPLTCTLQRLERQGYLKHEWVERPACKGGRICYWQVPE